MAPGSYGAKAADRTNQSFDDQCADLEVDGEIRVTLSDDDVIILALTKRRSQQIWDVRLTWRWAAQVTGGKCFTLNLLRVREDVVGGRVIWL